ncbi:CBY1-interacting BAR domain-containing protein 1 isoform X3 [Aotus nancymaae]|uniref:CBY1-interacting BAR domain-containing protein 1 isoform X3 n=1 Tax=Aotus nancymaae TaxID=37293 RepID=UPI0030FEF933
MMRRTLENRNAQTKQLQTAVSNVEKHFGELCQIFAAYVRKTARLRDKADLLVNEINTYAATETPHLKLGLMNFADEFARLQDYRQAEVERLEAKVVEPLKAYGTIVKMKRDDLKATFTARNREAKQLTQLERTRQRNPSDRHIIVSFEFRSLKKKFKAETELQRAAMDASRTSRHLEETIDNFERQKMKDIKIDMAILDLLQSYMNLRISLSVSIKKSARVLTIFSEFITIEMLFHGKALEVYTAAYQNIQNIDEDEDLEVSTCRLRKDRQAEDDEDEELDATEEEN